jgi:mannose-6-phosphate isomerase-like protein (cupin superfamily)
VPPAASVGEPKTVSVLNFLDRNFIGRDRQKDSPLGCTPSSTTGILQLRDSLAEHLHGQVDETLYVVAGDGTLIFDDGTRTLLGPSSLSIVPRGLPHAIERRGKNPLIILWVHAGESCADISRP